MAQKPRRKLDQRLDYGQITPEFHGAVFSQGGVNFDARGLEIFTDEDAAAGKQDESIAYWQTREEQAAKMRASKSAKQEVEDEPGDPDPDASETALDDTGDEDDDHTPPPITGGEIDLVNWAKGGEKNWPKEQKHSWFEIRSAFVKQYHFEPVNKNAAFEKLMDLSLIGPEDIGR